MLDTTADDRSKPPRVFTLVLSDKIAPRFQALALSHGRHAISRDRADIQAIRHFLP